MTTTQRVQFCIASVIAIFAYSIILKTIGGNIPLIDATSTVLSVIAMILLVKQYVEQWYLWVIINIVSIVLWVVSIFEYNSGDLATLLMWAISLKQGSGDMATLIMWTLFLANSIYGLYNWTKESKK